MKRTSPSPSEERMLARSPGCWIAGPEVTRIGTLSSWEMMRARVVFPSPGGPAKRMWSGEDCRFCAAVMKRSICFLRIGCPMKEWRVCGRSCSSL